jgi:hypothetical protein
MRDKLLNETLFFGLEHARAKIEACRRLQQPTPAFIAGLPDVCGLCRQPHRNVRPAAQPRPRC